MLLESNSFVRCIFVDFSKAFDTVCHEILLQKLVNFSCPQYVITWLSQFLTDRTQSVGHSTSIQIICSIRQGSGIGPYAFLAIISVTQTYIIQSTQTTSPQLFLLLSLTLLEVNLDTLRIGHRPTG